MRLARPILLLLACLTGCSSGRPLQRFECTEIIMAVPARIVLYAGDEDAARAAARAAFDRMSELEAVMSDYREDSELSRLCRQAGGPPVPASRDLHRVLALAGAVSRASDGAFDVTSGPLVLLWRDARRTGRLPDPEVLAEAMRRVGWRQVELREEPRTVRLAAPGMRLDLGGIGKGFAADEAVGVLEERGLRHCLVALAGDIVAGDGPPGSDGWRVSVASGLRGETPLTLRLARQAVSTSGDSEQFVEVGGRRYSHIIDPRSGMALTQRRAATVIARDGATADALATAMSVLDPERAVALAESLPGCAVLVQEEGEGPVRATRSRGFGEGR